MSGGDVMSARAKIRVDDAIEAVDRALEKHLASRLAKREAWANGGEAAARRQFATWLRQQAKAIASGEAPFDVGYRGKVAFDVPPVKGAPTQEADYTAQQMRSVLAMLRRHQGETITVGATDDLAKWLAYADEAK